MKICLVTLFPEIFTSFFQASLISKAIEKELFAIELVNPRDFSPPPHHHVDDTPYGGGAGMVMKPEPLAKAILRAKEILPDAKVTLLSPHGEKFSQASAHLLSKREHHIFVCGRYEGIDQRVIDLYVDHQISLGDFILMGGEVAAMALIEATLRLKPGILGNELSTKHESFSEPLLEAPHYTRPPEFEGIKVPEVLLSGDHKKIEEWRTKISLELTKTNRPDLLKKKE